MLYKRNAGMGLPKFYITLDRENSVFFPGQEIRGSVHIRNDKPKNVNGIYVEFRGLAKVSFEQSKDNTYSTKERYFNQRVTLNAGDVMLAEGQHQFSFSFTLPQEIPSSFEGAHGDVCYTIRAVYERSIKRNRKCKIPITVNSITDLNTIPESIIPVKASDCKTIGIFQSNPITASFWIDHQGFVPGEIIYFNAKVENLTGKTMRGTKVQIIQRTSFHVKKQTAFHKKVIYESIKGAQVWENHPIVVPPVVSSNLQFCDIINFSVDLGAFSSNSKVVHNLIIGNVPLRSSFSHPQQNIVDHTTQKQTENISNAATNSGDGMASLIANDYPDLPPPSFEECMFGAGNKGEAGDTEHAH